ncbi:MAG TPA: hypothetical protein VF172_07995 [Nitrososphaera sp.]
MEPAGIIFFIVRVVSAVDTVARLDYRQSFLSLAQQSVEEFKTTLVLVVILDLFANLGQDHVFQGWA